jgi:Pyruvate/2-oxoacid:ferredoxin oxidoreductase gamma subunit
MLGSLTRIIGLIPEEAMEKAVLDSVPPRTIELNKKALQVGFTAAEKVIRV